MELHRVTTAAAWRPDDRGQRRRQHVAHCLCGWSTGWLTRHEAAAAGEDHRSAAALAGRLAKLPDPAA